MLLQNNKAVFLFLKYEYTMKTKLNNVNKRVLFLKRGIVKFLKKINTELRLNERLACSPNLLLNSWNIPLIIPDLMRIEIKCPFTTPPKATAISKYIIDL